jgi:preprotein translocase subunit SecA
MSLLVESCQIDRWITKQLKKEKLQIRQKTETVAAITYQNFLLYPKLSGMTGTGKTAEVEFEKIYNLLRRSQQLVQIKEKICQI